MNDMTSNDRNLSAADYQNLRNYYARLAVTEALSEVPADTAPAADRVQAIAGGLIRREAVMADPGALTLALRHGSDAGQYDGQLARNRAETALTNDVTDTALTVL